jgi:hypothetical protein
MYRSYAKFLQRNLILFHIVPINSLSYSSKCNKLAHNNIFNLTGFEAFETMIMKCSVFWDTASCSPLKVNRCFGGICRFHLQGIRVMR